MKNILKYMAIAAMTLTAVLSCKKNGPEFPEGSGPVAGQWHMIQWSSISSDRADVYVSFGEDGTFDLYQRVYTPYYEHYEGTYTQDGGQVTGTYSDGTPWSSSYTASFSNDRTEMTLTPDDGSGDVVYEAADIPEDVLSGLLSGTKSETNTGTGFRFL